TTGLPNRLPPSLRHSQRQNPRRSSPPTIPALATQPKPRRQPQTRPNQPTRPRTLTPGPHRPKAPAVTTGRRLAAPAHGITEYLRDVQRSVRPGNPRRADPGRLIPPDGTVFLAMMPSVAAVLRWAVPDVGRAAGHRLRRSVRTGGFGGGRVGRRRAAGGQLAAAMGSGRCFHPGARPLRVRRVPKAPGGHLPTRPRRV